MWIGVGVVAAAAYYFWNKSKTAPSTSADTTKKIVGANSGVKIVPVSNEEYFRRTHQNAPSWATAGPAK